MIKQLLLLPRSLAREARPFMRPTDRRDGNRRRTIHRYCTKTLDAGYFLYKLSDGAG